MSLHKEHNRTTSALEGYNSYLSTRIPTHGNFWEFFKVLKHDESRQFNELSQTLDGFYEVFERPKKRNRDRHDLINELVSKYDLGEITLKIFLQSMTNKSNNIMRDNAFISTNFDSESSESEEEDEKIADGLLCEVCFTNKKNTILKPCKHGKICRACFDEINKRNLENDTLTLCPFCKQVVGHVEEFYI